MATTNKITKLYPVNGVSLSEDDIQAHIDSMNADGWYLVCLQDLSGWYRFFWAKIS